MIVQRLVNTCIQFLSLIIANYKIVNIIESRAHVIIIPIVSIQATWVSKFIQENVQGDYFSIEAFEDTEVHWWLFEVERDGKAVQILAFAHGKVMNIL